jgi:hypothetical protein
MLKSITREGNKLLLKDIVLETINPNIFFLPNTEERKYTVLYKNYSEAWSRKVFSKELFDIGIAKYNEIKSLDLKISILNMIGKCIYEVPNSFYIGNELDDIISLMNDEVLKDNMILLIKQARENYLESNLYIEGTEHDITRAARLSSALLDKSKLEKYLTREAKMPISSWPKVSISAEQNFLDNQEMDIDKLPSLNDLLRFSAHIVAPTLFIFNIESNGDSKSEKLINDLKEHLLQEGYLNSIGYLKKAIFYNIETPQDSAKKPEVPKSPNKFINSCMNSIKKNIPKDNDLTITTFENNLKDIVAQSRTSRYEIVSKLTMFSSISAVSLLIQTLEHTANIPNNLQRCLLAKHCGETIINKLYDTLLIAKYGLQINATYSLVTDKEQQYYDLALNIVEKNIKLPTFKSMILQSGDPIKLDKFATNHAFYVLIDKVGSKFKITIVNGGSNADEDLNFEASESGLGANWICRQIITADETNASVYDFLTHYIYKVISLRYTKSLNDEDFKKILGNIYLKDNEFIGFNGYKIDNSNDNTLLQVIPKEQSPSFPSQVVENCTIHNLKQAIKILFNWNEAQFAQFVHDMVIRYNSLLKNHLPHEESINNNLVLGASEEIKSQEGDFSVIEDDYRDGIMDNIALYQDVTSNILTIASSARNANALPYYESILSINHENDQGNNVISNHLIATIASQFIIPGIKCLKDTINDKNQDYICYSYYKQSLDSYPEILFKSSVAGIVFSLSYTQGVSLVNAMIISKVATDAVELIIKGEYNSPYPYAYAFQTLQYVATMSAASLLGIYINPKDDILSMIMLNIAPSLIELSASIAYQASVASGDLLGITVCNGQDSQFCYHDEL